MHPVLRMHGLAAVAFTAAGCVSLSVFQSPETLAPGEVVGGIGAAAYAAPGEADGVGVWPEIGLRYGLDDDVDVGLKFSGIPPFGAIYGDARLQLSSEPRAVTAGLGVSVPLGTAATDGINFVGLYPSLALGSERFWVTGRGVIVVSGSAGDLSAGTLWGVVIGTTLGDEVRTLPEMEVYFGSGDVLVGLGIGLQLKLRDGDEGG